MDTKETEFIAKLLTTFKIEAEEHLKLLSDGLLALESEQAEKKRKSLVEEIFREAHSLKGAARSVNHETIQSICQSLENVLAAWKQGRLNVSREVFDTLYATVDIIGKLIALPPKSESKEDNITLIALMLRLDQLLIAKQMAAPLSTPPPSAPLESATPIEQPPPSAPLESATPIEQPQDSSGPSPSKQKTIRIPLDKLNKLLQEVEEMLMLKLAARQQVNDLRNMQDLLKVWDKKLERMHADIHSIRVIVEGTDRAQIDQTKIMQNTLGFIDWQQQFIKSLKDNLNRLVKMSAQDYRLAGGAVDTLLDDTRKLLMQPFSTLIDVFPRMIRDISHSQKKEIRLEVLGGEIEIDRRILEEMKDPLTHIIRNCIDHGIELPEVRVKANKPPYGTIKVVASQVSSNSMELLITDDGQGINFDKVKASAIEQGVLTATDAALLNEQEALMLVFQSGVSTNPIITELSGRGLGMGIVSEKVDKLGGQVYIETKMGQGSSFRIVLPLTLATFRGMQIKVADQDFIIPSHNIKRVIRIRASELKSVENQEIISVDDRAVSFIPLSNILQLSTSRSKDPDAMLNAVIVKSAERTIAFGVDQIVNEQEVLVKALGMQLKRVKNVLAASITEWGQVIPILNPQDLVKSSLTARVSRPSQEVIAEEAEEKKKVILLAEDSITSRLLIKNILESAGYEVKAAVDGLEAFSLFKLEKIDLVLSDVEMPRMDGFVLTEKIRSLEKGKKIPVVLCTSRESTEDKEHGIEVGANAYLEKSRFSQVYLLDILKKLL